MRGDAVEAADPLLMVRVVSNDVLDVKDLLADVLTRRYIDRLMRQLELADCGAVDAGAITAQQGIGREHLGEQATDRGQINLVNHRIEVVPFPILDDQHRNLLGRHAAFGGRTSAMSRRTRQFALAFERLKEIRLVGFDDIVQLGVLFLGWPLQQSMAPAKRRAHMNS